MTNNRNNLTIVVGGREQNIDVLAEQYGVPLDSNNYDEATGCIATQYAAQNGLQFLCYDSNSLGIELGDKVRNVVAQREMAGALPDSEYWRIAGRLASGLSDATVAVRYCNKKGKFVSTEFYRYAASKKARKRICAAIRDLCAFPIFSSAELDRVAQVILDAAAKAGAEAAVLAAG